MCVRGCVHAFVCLGVYMRACVAGGVCARFVSNMDELPCAIRKNHDDSIFG